MNTWDYRVCTKKNEHGRIFAVLPVYYENGKAKSYGEQWNQYIGETQEDLERDFKKRYLAFVHDVIDLDNFPALWLG